MIVALYGRWEVFEQALGALLANTEPSYELIVIDNNSPDGSAERLAAITKNVRIVRNLENYGVIRANNAGAALASGDYLVSMNSDAIVHEGWLESMLERARSHRRVAAIGPRYLNPDGTVQEAGALLFRDGTTAAYGSGRSSADPELRRPRVVDYISNACMLYKREAFEEMSGFDVAYAPAYYSDVDICLRLSAAGYLTMYEPRSTVTHVYGWAEKEVGEDWKRSRAFFARRWRDLLAARPEPRLDLERNVILARDAALTDRVLIAGQKLPVEGSLKEEAVVSVASCSKAHVALLLRDLQNELAQRLISAGVECVSSTVSKPEEWLQTRRFHYDLVLDAGLDDPVLADEIRRTQPQATWVELEAASNALAAGSPQSYLVELGFEPDGRRGG